MSEENIIFQYQVKLKTTMGIRYYYFYANTDIENYLNNKNIKYVRYTKDTALNKKEKRIRELFKENQQLKNEIKASKEVAEEHLKKEIQLKEKHLNAVANYESEKSKNQRAINNIDILQEIIYQQPTSNSADDLWLLDKLDGIKNILKGENNE